jgi:hypothetical protein
MNADKWSAPFFWDTRKDELCGEFEQNSQDGREAAAHRLDSGEVDSASGCDIGDVPQTRR